MTLFLRGMPIQDILLPTLTGVISSAPFEGDMQGDFYYMVKLDVPRYCELHQLYLSHIVMSASNIKHKTSS